MSAVSKPSGPDMADTSTPCDIPNWLAPWFVGLESPIRLVRTPPVTSRGDKGRHGVEHHHTPPRERGKGLPAKFKPSGPNLEGAPDPSD
eukprot:4480592-Pleurochrysis_carterae.AAC.1